MSKTVPTNNAMQFHCTEIKPVSNKYTQNKQLFRYFVGIDSLHASKSSTLNYEVKVANTEEVKNTTLRMLSKKLNICLKCPHFLLLKHALQPGLKLECILSLLALLCLEMLQGLLQYLYLIVLAELSSPPSEIYQTA